MERERADLKSQLQEQESQMKGLESQIIIAESQFARAIADAEVCFDIIVPLYLLSCYKRDCKINY